MFLKLIPLMLELQKKLYSLIYGRKYSNIIDNTDRTTKTFYTKTESLVLNSKTKQKVQETTKIAKEIMKQHINEPEKILEFIKSKGTKIIIAKNIDKILTLLHLEEGFVTPLKGFKALFLTIMINILSKDKVAIGFKTSEMFVMRSLDLNIYSLAHQFHHWIAFKKKLPGYEASTMDNFKNIWQIDSTPNGIKSLSVNEILSLKDAIDRDKEAIEFVKTFSREQQGSKEFLNKLREGQKVSL